MEFPASRLIYPVFAVAATLVVVAALAIGIPRIWVGVHYPGGIAADAAVEVYVWNRWRHDPSSVRGFG
jgi:hypothetical protein